MRRNSRASTDRNSRRQVIPELSKRDHEGSLVVLGVDPGTLITGYGIVEKKGPDVRMLGSGIIVNQSSASMPARLHKIYSGLLTVITHFHPDEFAIEAAFYSKNAQSALKLGHARGVSMLAAEVQGIPTSEYSPREVKKAVVGNGTASKEQVQYMIRSLLHLRDARMAMDISDALAVAICHLHRLLLPGKKRKDWKSFVTAHPERLVQ